MPDRPHSTPTPKNAFDLDFLAEIDEHDATPTSFQARYGCTWNVVPLGDECFGLYRPWESPGDGDEPFAVLTDRSSAYLAAAFLPLLAHTRSLWLHHDTGKKGFVLYRDGQPVGHMPAVIDELTDALNLADALARTPTSLACLLAAAGPEAMAQAGRILTRGVLSPV